MGRPTDREETRRNLKPGDRLLEGQAEIGDARGITARSSVSSFCHHYEFIGRNSKGYFSTVFSCTASGLEQAERHRVADAQSANGSKGAKSRSREAQSASGKKSVDNRPRDEHGRLLPRVLETLVP